MIKNYAHFFIRALAHLQHTTVWLNCRSFHRWADFLTSFGFGLREDPLSTHSFSSHFITNTKNVHDCTYITILNVQICTIISDRVRSIEIVHSSLTSLQTVLHAFLQLINHSHSGLIHGVSFNVPYICRIRVIYMKIWNNLYYSEKVNDNYGRSKIPPWVF